MEVVNGAPLSDLFVIKAADIWGKLFLSRRLFILVFSHICSQSRTSVQFLCRVTLFSVNFIILDFFRAEFFLEIKLKIASIFGRVQQN